MESSERKDGSGNGDDRPVPKDAINSHASVQPKAVFYYAMTVMDKICGWEEHE